MKRLYIILLFAILIGLFHSFLFLSPWGEAFELKFLDLWFNLRGPLPPPKDIVIVSMDEDSYSILGLSPNQPWPRAIHIKLIEKLKSLGAKRLVFDILFLGAGPDPDVDKKLADTFSSIPTILGADYGVIEEGLYKKEGLILPLDKFREKCEKIALIGFPEEAGYVRKFMTCQSILTKDMPSLAEAAVQTIKKPGNRDLINYYGPSRTIPTFSYYQVLETEYPLSANFFQDKIVFIGLSLRTELGPSQKDSYLTPFFKKGRMYGVEIHATAAGNLLKGNWIKRESVWFETSILSLFALLLGLGIFSLRPQWGALLLIGSAVCWALISYFQFLNLAFIPGAVLTIMVMPFSYLGSTLYYYVVTYRKQRRLQKAFQFYLSPEMSREVSRNPQALKLGGEKVTATAMFTDIAGFTEISEPLPPEKVANMLNSYFTEITNALFEKRGTLIKFIGDAIFALWGAPIKTLEHAQLACESALAIQKEIERFNNTGRFPILKTRIGINTGPMIVGNMGSERRFDFTAIGDSVNLASRVEGINKYFGTSILITDSVKEALNKNILSLKMGSIRVVGKKECVVLHALFTEPVSTDLWPNALDQFYRRNWDKAINAFKEIALREPVLKKASELYLKQIELHQQTPPPQEWQGEIIFSSK